MQKHQIVYRNPSELRPRINNPRTHAKKQIETLAEWMQHYGFYNAVLIDKHDVIIAGHARVEAAKVAEIELVPTVCLHDVTEDDIRAIVIADNKMAELGQWDKKLLGMELKYLSEVVDYDLTILGFDMPEIDILIADVITYDDDGDDPDDELPDKPNEPAVTRLGDLWQIGSHFLICGDALAEETYARLLGKKTAAMVFSDPPYNVPVNGHVSGLGKVQHREFAMASGEMSVEEFTAFLTSVFRQLARFSAAGSIHFQCIDWRHMGEMIAAGGDAYSELKNLCVWTKGNGGMGSLYRSAHELVFVFKAGTGSHTNNVQLGKHGRYRTNVWAYAGANSFGATRDEDLAMHPTVKPVGMIADAILDCSKRRDIVLDPFAGSGSTLVAAHRTGRRGYGIELDPEYCDTIIQRLMKSCGLEAVLVGDGRRFHEVKAERQTKLLEVVE